MIKETIKKFVLLAFILTFALLHLSSCKSRSGKSGENPGLKSSVSQVKSEKKIQKVIFFLENSESMFGYVSGFTEYVDVISELAEKPEFAAEKTLRDFYFVNGKDLKINYLGKDPKIFKENLNATGYNKGDITKSNLNGMFQMALDSAYGEKISILISDGLYDIGQLGTPFNALATEGRETRSRFVQRLSTGNLQTIMIKLYSRFDGTYYFASKKGAEKIKQTRPFYIWIFGETDLLNKYFTENYIVYKLKGYNNMARFLKQDIITLPFQATTQNLKGSFRFDKSNNNKLFKASVDRNMQGFQFSIAVDFSLLPFSDSYKEFTGNYSCSGNFKVVSVKKIDGTVFGVTTFVPTHLITVFTDKSPYGVLEVNLKNILPSWIDETDTNNESNIKVDSTHTFGFKYLTNGMSEAYQFISKQKNLANFRIEILK